MIGRSAECDVAAVDAGRYADVCRIYRTGNGHRQDRRTHPRCYRNRSISTGNSVASGFKFEYRQDATERVDQSKCLSVGNISTDAGHTEVERRIQRHQLDARWGRFLHGSTRCALHNQVLGKHISDIVVIPTTSYRQRLQFTGRGRGDANKQSIDRVVRDLVADNMRAYPLVVRSKRCELEIECVKVGFGKAVWAGRNCGIGAEGDGIV